MYASLSLSVVAYQFITFQCEAEHREACLPPLSLSLLCNAYQFITNGTFKSQSIFQVCREVCARTRVLVLT